MSSPTSRGTSSSTYHPLLNTTTSLRSSLSLLPSSSDAFASTDDWTNVLTSTAKGCRYCSICQVSPVGWGMDGSLTHIPMCYYTMEFKRLNTSDSWSRTINVPRISEIQHLCSTRGTPFQLAFTACFSWCALPSMYSNNPDSSHPAKQLTLTVLKDIITTGYLEISDLAGTYYYGRQQDGCEGVRLTIVDDKFWLRVFL